MRSTLTGEMGMLGDFLLSNEGAKIDHLSETNDKR